MFYFKLSAHSRPMRYTQCELALRVFVLTSGGLKLRSLLFCTCVLLLRDEENCL